MYLSLHPLYQIGGDCGGDECVGSVDEKSDGEEEADAARVAWSTRLGQWARRPVTLVRQELWRKKLSSCICHTEET